MDNPTNDDPEATGSASTGLAIDREALLASQPLLRRALDLVLLNTPGDLLRFFLLIVLPLTVFSVVTILEDRFAWGSVQASSPELGGRLIRGMSFLGDTSVWPYMILIPLLLLLMNVVLSRMESFFASSESALSASWLSRNEEFHQRTIEKTLRIARLDGRWRLLRILGIAAGLGFFAWNTVTCSFPDRFVPYKTTAPYVMGSDGEFVQETQDAAIPVPKWDTDPASAPLSWLATRLWVLVMGYVWIPLVLFRLFSLVAATYFYTDQLASQEGALDIKPLSPDNAGGLSRLSALAVALTYPMVIVGLMMAMFFIKENTNPSLHNLLIVVPVIPIFFAIFFLPLLGVHRAMANAKEEYLLEFSALFDKVHQRFLEEVRSPTLEAEEFTRLEISMRGLSESYERISRMPVWPFEASTLYRLFTAVLIPIAVPILMELVIGRLAP